jgi:hypothetical protein
MRFRHIFVMLMRFDNLLVCLVFGKERKVEAVATEKSSGLAGEGQPLSCGLQIVMMNSKTILFEMGVSVVE